MRNLKNNLVLLLILITLIFNYSCSKSEENTLKTEVKDSIAFEVGTEIVKRGAISEYLVFSGVVKSFSNETILPEVAGRILNLYKEVGDHVKKGDLLFDLESTIYKARSAQAEAAFETAKMALEDMTKSKMRIDNLFKKNAISEREHEKATNGLIIAENNYKQANAAYTIAKFQYKNTKVFAPFNGIITAKLKNNGDFINPSMSGSSPLGGVYVLENFDNIYVDADIPFSRRELIKNSLKVDIIVDHLKLRGKILSISDKVDALSSTFYTRILSKNSEHKILPGTIVALHIHYKFKEDAIVIPTKALLEDNIVFKFSDNRSIATKVETGLKNSMFTEIISGLTPGESIITIGNFGLFNDAIVREIKK